MHRRRLLRTAALLGSSALALTALSGPAHAAQPRGESGAACFSPAAAGARTAGTARTRSGDTRDISAAEQRAIEVRTQKILDRRGKPGGGGGGGTSSGAAVPVYVHVMLDDAGNGDVTQTQIDQQVSELNQDYAGGESSAAASTGFTFTLAKVDRYYNNQWHKDRASNTYRKATRLGGADALNIWLVDFDYLGIATFPWDYAKNPGLDGIRVQWDSLPGGDITHYNLGKTATHEAGHWLGLYHTFQGGCTTPNDEVADTPAQSSPTSGCPEGRDSCSLPGLDPIHNYMDYSYDECYDQFTPDQATRMQSMWAAYRA
jgi:hypothetical protein